MVLWHRQAKLRGFWVRRVANAMSAMVLARSGKGLEVSGHFTSALCRLHGVGVGG